MLVHWYVNCKRVLELCLLHMYYSYLTEWLKGEGSMFILYQLLCSMLEYIHTTCICLDNVNKSWNLCLFSTLYMFSLVHCTCSL